MRPASAPASRVVLSVGEVARRAATLGWHFTDEFPADSDCPYEAIWTLPESGTEVHYIVDDIAGASFFNAP